MQDHQLEKTNPLKLGLRKREITRYFVIKKDKTLSVVGIFIRKC